AAPVVVGAGDADVLRAQAEAGAGAHGRGHLPAAEHAPLADAHLGGRTIGLGIAGQEVDEVDGVLADSDHVPALGRHAGSIPSGVRRSAFEVRGSKFEVRGSWFSRTRVTEPMNPERRTPNPTPVPASV